MTCTPNRNDLFSVSISLADVPKMNRDPARNAPRSEVRDQRHRQGDGHRHASNFCYSCERTPSGRALAGMLAVFAEFERDILRDRVKAGIDQARKDGKPHRRPMTAGKLVPEMKQLRKDGISKRAIAKQLGVSRTSVIRLLRSRKRS